MKKIRVLVVDDAAFIRDLVKKTVRSKFPHFLVEEAINGRKAQSLLEKQRYDLVLCDWEMPELSGLELLQWMRNERSLDTPFIMVTSRGDRDNVVAAVQSGVSEYIGKPFSSDALLKKIIKVLSRRHSASDLRGSSRPDTPGGSAEVLTGGSATHAASVSVLTQSRPAPSPPPSPAATEASSSVAALTGAATTPAPAPKGAGKSGARGSSAQLRFPDMTVDCVVQALSLKEVKAVIRRGERIPQLLSQAVVDLEQGEEREVARINGYISKLEAAEQKMDSALIAISIRFVDDDPQKMEYLSKMIAMGTGKQYF
ncbi:response regulator [Aestuariirhabdus litorea]|uniref:Response regulator n=1 Tax=Aestuariirhabdus litorea TaxID=2528527 RepID=A0A3P3VNV6_9GAMM|nr:response regulator [Aestuariirhabdus litorea]RRJ82503.1 response regulator [Aestuariirhabdus litorea]RWW92664.1 response regulator [Endozoicomonadaceae bacterium GTF-13]